MTGGTEPRVHVGASVPVLRRRAGRLRWRSARPLARDLLAGEAHLLLAGRSYETEIQVGRVRVWSGPRYRLAGGP